MSLVKNQVQPYRSCEEQNSKYTWDPRCIPMTLDVCQGPWVYTKDSRYIPRTLEDQDRALPSFGTVKKTLFSCFYEKSFLIGKIFF